MAFAGSSALLRRSPAFRAEARVSYRWNSTPRNHARHFAAARVYLRRFSGVLMRATGEKDDDRTPQRVTDEADKSSRDNATDNEGLSRRSLTTDAPSASTKSEVGGLFAAIALISGTTVGAGILALPATTKEGGFLPSSVVLMLAWLYMSTTGNLIAETSIGTMHSAGRSKPSMLSLSEVAFGSAGLVVAGSAFILLHYALLVAYVAQGGSVLADFVPESMRNLPAGSVTAIFAISLGMYMYVGGEKLTEKANNALVVGILASFVALLGVIAPNVHTSYLQHVDIKSAITTMPIMFVVFVFQNVVTRVVSRLNGDLDEVRKAIFWGTIVPAGMFIAWNAVMLGTVSPDTLDFDPIAVIRGEGGTAATLMSVFSLLALSTSVFGFGGALLDFFKDARVRFGSPPSGASGDGAAPTINGVQVNDAVLFAATLAPPTIFAVLAPDVFFKAVDVAGTFGISTLFGILPCAMAWKQRYSGDSAMKSPFEPRVKGGKFALATIISVSLVIITSDLVQRLSHLVS